DGDGQAAGFGAHFGGAAVASAFASANLSPGAGFRSEENHTSTELAGGIDDRSAILFGQADKLLVRNFVYSGRKNQGEMADLRGVGVLKDRIGLANNENRAQVLFRHLKGYP